MLTQEGVDDSAAVSYLGFQTSGFDNPPGCYRGRFARKFPWSSNLNQFPAMKQYANSRQFPSR